ncbi:MAG: cation diffusion facilitator family transporter [Minisyncoccia bacterium]
MAHATRFHLDKCPSKTTGTEQDCSCDKEQKHYIKLATISFVLFLAEFFGGRFSGSKALEADAFHVLMDGTENMISVLVSRMARKGADEKKIRSIGAKVSAVLLFFIAGSIVYEGYHRFLSPHKVEGYMVVIAVIGLLGNLLQRKIHQGALHEHRNVTHFWQDMHLLSDIATSVAVIIGGLIMLVTDGYYWIDGLLSINIGVLIMIFTGARFLGVELHSHSHEGHDPSHDHPGHDCCKHKH